MNCKKTGLDSAGTLRAEFCVEDGKLHRVFFEPDDNHTVHHSRKKYAVFLPGGQREAEASPVSEEVRAASVENGPIKLSVSADQGTDFVRAVTDAAIGKHAVDVSVDFSPDVPKLVAVTVPAFSHRK